MNWREVADAQAARKREPNFGHIGSASCACEHCVSIRKDIVCNCVICQIARRHEIQRVIGKDGA